MRWLTPQGVAGVAVLAVPESERALVCRHLRLRGGGELSGTGPALRLAALHLDGAALDEVLVVDRFPDGLELHLHGAPAVRAALEAAGWPIAVTPPTARERLLREALDPAQLDLALEQAALPFAELCRSLRTLPPAARAAAAAAALQRSQVARAHLEPQRVVLVGIPNAGKSTLFNRLCSQERVLTGPTAGLTRDPIRERVALAGYPYEIVDTAGDDDTDHALDAAAVAAGRALRAAALVVLVVDASRGVGPFDRSMLPVASLVVANKIDQAGPPWPSAVPCHVRIAAAVEAPDLVRMRVGEALRTARGLPQAGPVGGAVALEATEWAELQALAQA